MPGFGHEPRSPHRDAAATAAERAQRRRANERGREASGHPKAVRAPGAHSPRQRQQIDARRLLGKRLGHRRKAQDEPVADHPTRFETLEPPRLKALPPKPAAPAAASRLATLVVMPL